MKISLCLIQDTVADRRMVRHAAKNMFSPHSQEAEVAKSIANQSGEYSNNPIKNMLNWFRQYKILSDVKELNEKVRAKTNKINYLN